LHPSFSSNQAFNPAFDLGRFGQLLQLPEPAPFEIRLQVHPQLSSSNDRLQALMNAGAPAGTAVLALEQTQGRGQQGRVWRSPPGGLYLSLGLRPQLPASEGHRLTLGSAWGIATRLNQRLQARTGPEQTGAAQQTSSPSTQPSISHPNLVANSSLNSNSNSSYKPTLVPALIPSVRLKWPNDLLLQGRKLGGILTESRLRGGIIHQAVIGLGLNWCNPVEPPAINLDSIRLTEPHGRIGSLEELAAIALQGLTLGYCHWCQGQPPLAPLIASYESLLSGLNQPVEISNPTPISKPTLGTLEGITLSGELKVSVNHETLRFPPGTIHLGYD
jgi:BirA family transcriptional regulator, biotin operon repressor / biotin---[acetyl-CoA-carboxylase] ligase